MSLKKIYSGYEVLKSTKDNTRCVSNLRSDISKECEKFLGNTNRQIEEVLNVFNELATQIGLTIKNDLPTNETVKNFNNKIKLVVNINYVEPMSLFIKHVYAHDEYRTSIKKGNDDFFLNVKPSEVFKKHSEIIENTENNLKLMFEFKEYWKDLKESTKLKVKQIMMTLIDLAKSYIEIKDDANEVAKILVKINKQK